MCEFGNEIGRGDERIRGCVLESTRTRDVMDGAMTMTMTAKVRMMTGMTGGEGERWRALQNHAIRERRMKENTQPERASAKWAAVASQARETRRRGGNWPRLPGLNEARRGAIYSRRDTYETSTLRNDG